MKLVFPPLYAIMDATLLRTSELAFAERLAGSGVGLIQYRNKSASTRNLFESSRRLSEFLTPQGVRFIVNDRADIALLAGAGGVHVGQEDLGVEEARAICGAQRWVGVSTHTLAQVEAAAKTSADYIAVGPVFATGTKRNSDPVVGVEFLRRARQATQKPLVAIGGITAERAAQLFEAGADSVAVISDLLAAEDLATRVREYFAAAEQAAHKAG